MFLSAVQGAGKGGCNKVCTRVIMARSVFLLFNNSTALDFVSLNRICNCGTVGGMAVHVMYELLYQG